METLTPPFDTGSDDIGSQIENLKQWHRQLAAYAVDLSTAYRQLRETECTLEESYISTLTALAAAIEARDPYLDGHSRSVMSYAVAVGEELALPAVQLELLRRAALLHDIGKIGVPDSALKKAGPLDETEWRCMRRHPELGYEILSSLTFLGEALQGIRHHHERYDGQGYPAGLAGEDIPLPARILSVCDAFDAMISNRIYRPAMTPAQAARELLAGRGSQFDPQIADRLAQVVSRGGWVNSYLTSTPAILSSG